MLMQRMTRISRRDVDSTVHIFEVEDIGWVREREVGEGGGGGLRKSERVTFYTSSPTTNRINARIIRRTKV